jgi:hypothetical protein
VPVILQLIALIKLLLWFSMKTGFLNFTID